MSKLVTYRYLGGKPYTMSVVEEGGNPYPSSSLNFRFNYKHYIVPNDFDLKVDKKILDTMYARGLALSPCGTIKVAPHKQPELGPKLQFVVKKIL